jgi:hypothetical protein
MVGRLIDGGIKEERKRERKLRTLKNYSINEQFFMNEIIRNLEKVFS